MRLSPLKSLSVIALTVGLTACATSHPASTPVIEPAAASPQPVPGQDWFLHQDTSNARLVYGVEQSDDMRLGLDCAKGSGRLALTALAPAGAARDIHLESGGDTERFAAEAEEDPLHDGLILSANARTADPVMQRFRRVGWMALWRGEQREVMVPHPESEPQIERFFAFCG